MRVGRGPTQGKARSCVPAVEPRKLGNNLLAAELCEVSGSASSLVFIYSAHVCTQPGAGAVLWKANCAAEAQQHLGNKG